MDVPITYFHKLIKENSDILTIEKYDLLFDYVKHYPDCSSENVYDVKILLSSLFYPCGIERTYYDKRGIMLSFIFPKKDYKDIPIDNRTHIEVKHIDKDKDKDEYDIICLYIPSLNTIFDFVIDFTKRKINLKSIHNLLFNPIDD